MTLPQVSRLCNPFPFLPEPFKPDQPPDVQADAARQPTRSSKAKRATHGVFFINSQLEHPDLHTLYIHRDRTEARFRRAARGMAAEGDGEEGKTETRKGKEGGQTGRRERIDPGRK
ncbi:hypothetical protein E2C01_038781 [Portunus trituberculatus]|uniref:Uncharacterized protein n=1 Tax=Portunus trituberculatus TaxID=210409 RepID=A0A5B7FI23_PORTR|nr:hypothetical protein [Portunus trituberculatus]